MLTKKSEQQESFVPPKTPYKKRARHSNSMQLFYINNDVLDDIFTIKNGSGIRKHCDEKRKLSEKNGIENSGIVAGDNKMERAPNNNLIPLIDLIGEGTFSNVYLAKRVYLLTAVKTGRDDRPDRKGRFTEVSILKNIDSPHVVRLISAWEDHGSISMETECCIPLSGIIERIYNNEKSSFSDELVVKLILHVAKGIYEVHKQGYVHLDVKADNVFYCLNDIYDVIASKGGGERKKSVELVEDGKKNIGEILSHKPRKNILRAKFKNNSGDDGDNDFTNAFDHEDCENKNVNEGNGYENDFTNVFDSDDFENKDFKFIKRSDLKNIAGGGVDNNFTPPFYKIDELLSSEPNFHNSLKRRQRDSENYKKKLLGGFLDTDDLYRSHPHFFTWDKPVNFLLDEILRKGTFKIGDLNIASAVGAVDEDGDSRYMAPEIIKSKCVFKSDVFSLGILFAELLSGIVLPKFGADWKMLREENLEGFGDLGIHGDFIKRMMKTDWRKRPSMKEVIEYLSAV